MQSGVREVLNNVPLLHVTLDIFTFDITYLVAHSFA